MYEAHITEMKDVHPQKNPTFYLHMFHMCFIHVLDTQNSCLNNTNL